MCNAPKNDKALVSLDEYHLFALPAANILWYKEVGLQGIPMTHPLMFIMCILTPGGLASLCCHRPGAVVFNRRDGGGIAGGDDASGQESGGGDERQESGVETHDENERRWARKSEDVHVDMDTFGGCSSKLNWALCVALIPQTRYVLCYALITVLSSDYCADL